MPYYNKTALKKVKKDELIKMFLDLQADKINDSLDEAVEKCCTNAIEEVVEDLKAENEILNSLYEKHKKLNENHEKMNEILKEKNEKLKAYKEYFNTWSPILRDVDGDDFCNLLSDYGWEYDDDGKLVNICVDYEDDEVDHYVDAGRKVVLKDGRIVKSKD